MRIVYLDQCALSNIALDSKNKDWETIGALLESLTKKRLAACPISTESLIETAALPLWEQRDQRPEIAALMESISGGLEFMDDFEMIAVQAVSLARSGNPLQESAIKKRASDPQHVTTGKFLNLSKMISERCAQVTQTTNRVLDARPNRDILREKDKENLGRATKRYMQEIAEALRNHRGTAWTGPILSPIKSKTVAHKVAASILSKANLSEEATAGLSKRIAMCNTIDLPYFWLTDELFDRVLLSKSAKLKKGDLIDFQRLTTALPYSDLIITDGPMKIAAETINLKLISKRPPHIFSSSPKDTPEIISLLSEWDKTHPRA